MNDLNVAQHDVEQPALDPNLAQRAASDPEHSIWVSASAGTGKTKVLTDRVLRLLLPRENGEQGTPPTRIVCLTFTKAAASEMSQRINETLGRWVVMPLVGGKPKDNLQGTLLQLLGHTPSEQQISAARRLFADVIDCAGGLKITTIHAFCQSILGRFPVEAGLPPNFRVVEDFEANALMVQARQKVMAQAIATEYAGSPLAAAFHNIAQYVDEKAFGFLMKSFDSERHQLGALTRQYGDGHGLYAAICRAYDIDPHKGVDDYYAGFCEEQKIYVRLREIARLMCDDGGKQAVKAGTQMLQWLAATPDERIALLDSYFDAFLTQKGTIRATGLPPAKVAKVDPQAKDILLSEAERVLALRDRVKALKSAILTRDLYVMGAALVDVYQGIKEQRGVCDFNDLILRTMALLRGRGDGAAAWVMYKLDNGIDHILVDEAQDTNPEQWSIIDMLCAEFFHGMSARDDTLRTSFTVGDIKQSIYSFQRAAPDEFKYMQTVFDKRMAEIGRDHRAVRMDISFRTTRSVLDVVDQVFAMPELNAAVGGGAIEHKPFREGQAGCVALWPLFAATEVEKIPYWTPPVTVYDHKSATTQMAQYIAQQIKGWLDRGEVLESYARPIEPQDIMILVRSRSTLVPQLVRALKVENIPVSGADRMVLNDEIAAQDMMAVAQFALCPDDDLTLGAVLKSPFLGWDEDDLFALAHGRKGTLWQALKSYAASEGAGAWQAKSDAAYRYLQGFIVDVMRLGAFEFFSDLIQKPCPASAKSGLCAMTSRLGYDAVDPIDEVLNQALNFRHQHVDHMQHFIEMQQQNPVHIKREMEDAQNEVRIMTVHGSKGLQAPIVIMPDTIKTGSDKQPDRFVWPDKSGLDVPLYSPRKDDDPAMFSDIYQKRVAQDNAEYYRLLYVAMTRAEERLYLVGAEKGKTPLAESWYLCVQRAMQHMPSCVEDEDGVLSVSNPQIAAPDKAKVVVVTQEAETDLPAWALRHPMAEPLPPRPLVPSRDEDDAREAAMSPLYAAQNYRFRRGNITHKVLQILPDIPDDRKAATARYFVDKNAQDLSQAVRDSIVDEVMAILTADEFKPFFSPQAQAEVSLTGMMGHDRIVSGQIDRLVIDAEDIWILDYKTNRPPPTDPKDIPALYRKQMKAYRDTIAAIYPEHRIHCGLLWTDGPSLMVLYSHSL